MAPGSLSPVALGALLGVAALLAALLSRIAAAAFPGSKPPVFEGIPFVGGLLKFAKASAA